MASDCWVTPYIQWESRWWPQRHECHYFIHRFLCFSFLVTLVSFMATAEHVSLFLYSYGHYYYHHYYNVFTSLWHFEPEYAILRWYLRTFVGLLWGLVISCCLCFHLFCTDSALCFLTFPHHSSESDIYLPARVAFAWHRGTRRGVSERFILIHILEKKPSVFINKFKASCGPVICPVALGGY